MAKSTFSNWQLSSSDSEDDKLMKGVLLTVKKAKANVQHSPTNTLDITVDEYVPLADRLKRRQITNEGPIYVESDDELPVFSLPSKSYNRTEKGGESVDLTQDPVRDILLSPLKMPKAAGSNEKNSARGKSKVRKRVQNRSKDTVTVSNLHINPSEIMDMNPTQDPVCVVTAVSSTSLDVPKGDVSKEKNLIQTKPKVPKTLQNHSKNETKSNLNARLKVLKPEECLKHMECLISSKLENLFENFDLLDGLKKDSVSTCILTQSETPCVRWRRMVPPVIDEESQNEVCNEETDVLVAISAADFIKMIYNKNDSIVGSSSENTMSSWIETMQIQMKDSTMHLVCMGMEKYSKALKAKKAKQDKKGDCDESSKRKMRKTAIPNYSRHDIEMATIELHIKFNITTTYVETAEEFVTLIKQMTKSVGEAPYKRMKRQDVQFINEIPSAKINVKTGEGKRQAWKQMIQQFHNVTTVMATAITDRYSSVIALINAYEECGTDVNKAEMLLADIPVRRGVGTLQTSRRIGPELSYKIYRQMTSSDPKERLY